MTQAIDEAIYITREAFGGAGFAGEA